MYQPSGRSGPPTSRGDADATRTPGGSAGSWPFATRSDADRWLAARRTDLKRRTHLDDRAATRPLRAWWPGYLRTAQTTLKTSTILNYEQAWRLRVEPGLGSVPVGRLRASHIEDWIADMVAAGVSSSKIIESHGVLKRVLDRAVRDRAISTNRAPCVEVRCRGARARTARC